MTATMVMTVVIKRRLGLFYCFSRLRIKRFSFLLILRARRDTVRNVVTLVGVTAVDYG